MIALGNLLFRFRNGIFPVVIIALLVVDTVLHMPPLFADFRIPGTAGLLLLLAGQLVRGATIGLFYIKRGGKERRIYAESLVQEGIFAHCRNPMYLGNLLIVAGACLASNSLFIIAVGVPLFALVYVALILAEEAYLRTSFGAEFDAYCKRVPRLLPRLSGFRETLRNSEFHWHRLLVKEYATTYAWIAGFLLLIIRDDYLQTGHVPVDTLAYTALALLVVASIGFLVVRHMKKSRMIVAD